MRREKEGSEAAVPECMSKEDHIGKNAVYEYDHIEKPSGKISVLARICLIISCGAYVLFFAFALNNAYNYYNQIGCYGKYNSIAFQEIDISVLNSAEKESLMEIEGIGEKRADLIIAFRDSIGGFTDPRQIMYLDGIGEKLFIRILEHYYSGFGYSDGSIIKMP